MSYGLYLAEWPIEIGLGLENSLSKYPKLSDWKT